MPPYTYVKDKAVDPGKIYVHSKVLIVDQAFAMVGSANINECSMWHDTENAVLFRSTEREDAADALRKNFSVMC